MSETEKLKAKPSIADIITIIPKKPKERKSYKDLIVSHIEAEIAKLKKGEKSKFIKIENYEGVEHTVIDPFVNKTKLYEETTAVAVSNYSKIAGNSTSEKQATLLNDCLTKIKNGSLNSEIEAAQQRYNTTNEKRDKSRKANAPTRKAERVETETMIANAVRNAYIQKKAEEKLAKKLSPRTKSAKA